VSVGKARHLRSPGFSLCWRAAIGKRPCATESLCIKEGFAVSVPGLPGCWSQGATESEAIENAKDAIRHYLAVVNELLRNERVHEIEVSL
jgi:predicted RNase H-like HicB family nuclease